MLKSVTILVMASPDKQHIVHLNREEGSLCGPVTPRILHFDSGLGTRTEWLLKRLYVK